jgi:plastocyanin
MMKRALACSLLGGLTLSASEISRWPQAAPAPGSVRGTVRVATALSPLAELPVNRSQDTCGPRTPDPSLVVGPDRALANVLVTLSGTGIGEPPPPSAEPARLDQKGCVFLPHLQAVPVGTTLEIANSDPILHNVHAVLEGETLFNLAMPVQNYRIRRKLERPGLVRLKCDAGHTWMSGYIWVLSHPYSSVTDTAGAYWIRDVPAGSYELQLWHERLGEKKVELTVEAGRTSRLDLELAAPPAR